MKQHNTFQYRALTGLAVCAMVYLFFHQAQLILKPVPIAFNPMHVAYGYTGVTFSGTYYHDEGVTPVGTGTGVAIHINGAASATTTTTNGAYAFTNQTISENDVITVYVDNENEDAVLVMKVSEDEVQDKLVTGMDIYKDRLIIRTSTASTVNFTTTDLQLADNGADGDVSSVYTFNGNHLQLGADKELFIHENASYTMSGSLFTHDLDVRGTLGVGAGNIVASGSVVVAGTMTTNGDLTLSGVSSGEVLILNSVTLNNLYVDNGLEAYFRMDEGTGTNLSGSTLNTGTGGSLANGTAWTATNTGVTLFYNPFALEFDGTNDSVTFSDAWDLSTAMKRTFSMWFRRKSSTTEDVLFSKKLGSGSSKTGYMLYIDDDSDKLNFELADGSNTYTVTSTSSVTDQNWHHVAVSFNGADNNATNIFLDGAIDVSSKSGSLDPSSASVTNNSGFILGNNTDSTGPFIGSMDDFRIYNRTLTGTEIAVLGAGTKKSTGSGTYYIQSPITVAGDLGIYAGTVDVGTGYALNVAGDLNVYGELNTNSGSVTLNGTAQTIRGSTAFNQLSKSVTTATTLTFQSNTEQTVSGAITLNGATNQRLKLRATVSADQAFLIVEDSGATVLKHLDVKDNNALSGALLSCTTGCVNSANNINWEFLGECGDGVKNTGESCDDGNTNNLDTCPNDCQNPVCGDSVVEGLEECDPPNVGQCASNCVFRGTGGGNTGIRSSAGSTGSFFNRPDPPDGCGNGILELERNEECDAGKRFNGLGTCSFDCKLLECGDGIISPENGEDCEPTVSGASNGVTTFTVATCGEICTAPITTAEGTKWGGCKRMFLPPCGGSSSSASTSLRVSKCGDGVVDPGEECDFGGICEGGDFNGSFWTDRASVTICEGGGGAPEPRDGDGCSSLCKTEFCGDGAVQERGADNQPQTADDEQCDNGSVCSNDINTTCRLDSDCGTGNSCDFHAAKDRTCSSSCKKTVATTAKPKPIPKPSAPTASSARCGNSKVEATEECDLGSNNGNVDSTCTIACKTRVIDRSAQSTEEICGNAVVDKNEECDKGDKNSDMIPNACRTGCINATCGDFVIDANEQCDNGNGNSDFYSDSCRLDCTLPRCGDGVQDSGEECDGSFSCNPNCTLVLRPSQCGNGVVESGEQCDDANKVSGDGCSTFCQTEEIQEIQSICGNSIIEKDEQCDDGNTENGDGCSEECSVVEIAIRKAAVTGFNLDADIVVVNPTEIAIALKFTTGNDPCSTLVMKGQNQKAALIRAAAVEQKIPIVRNIALAREIYTSIRPREIIGGTLCTQINELKSKPKGIKKTSAPMQPVPQQPPEALTQYAQITPLISQQGPVGDTGPAAATVAASGLAAGWSWIRRKRMTKSSIH